MKNIYIHLPYSGPELSELVLATVCGTSGSTPQKPGSSAVFNRSGLVTGTIGGGVLEGKVEKLAKKSLLTRYSEVKSFSLDRLSAGGEDALCGGRIEILIDSDLGKHSHVFQKIRESVSARTPGVLITVLAGEKNGRTIIDRYWVTTESTSSVPAEILEHAGPKIDEMLGSLIPGDFHEYIVSGRKEKSPFHIFLELIKPYLRLVIAGAGHIGKALSGLGQMLDFDVTVIDDRPEFANPANIPSADHIIASNIGKSVAEVEKGKDTFIVIVTRGHRDDANALRSCISSDAAYIGMIGSRNKVALMKQEFISNGWASKEEWDRIFTPVGLDIGSVTVEEIAVSIAAQLIQIKNRIK
jgi:xanthine dehydrogenase accessory factor